MSIYAQSLKRLFEAGKLAIEQIQAQVEKGRITEKEYAEITGA